MRILAIETSCDETAAAVVEDGTMILGSSIATSAAMHEKYGGIVPEVAAREQLNCMIPVIEEALTQYKGVDVSLRKCVEDDIDAIAVTVGPGLIGSLLVGVETAKTISLATGKPVIPVNHVLAHMYANFLSPPSVIPTHEPGSMNKKTWMPDQVRHDKSIQFPAISLVVSGGHTELFLMTNVKDLKWLGGTLDDAAGEAFDKTARLLGFGSRGGLAIQESASKCQSVSASMVKLPRPMLDNDNYLNFSFSGLKTAILRQVNTLKDSQQFNNETIEQLSFEVQESITDVLVKKTLRAAEKYNAKSIFISGGVASNLRLREKMSSTIEQFNNRAIENTIKQRLTLHVPPVPLCTDNAAYIASYAFFRGKPVDWHEITAVPDLSVEV
jgi:N6-L-threonylcarbamoyladenine synthase